MWRDSGGYCGGGCSCRVVGTREGNKGGGLASGVILHSLAPLQVKRELSYQSSPPMRRSRSAPAAAAAALPVTPCKDAAVPSHLPLACTASGYHRTSNRGRPLPGGYRISRATRPAAAGAATTTSRDHAETVMPGSLDAVGRPTPESAHRTPNDAVLVQNRRQNIDAAHPAHCIVDGVRRGRNRRWRNAVAGLVGPTRAGAGIASIVALPMPPPLASASAGPPLPLVYDATGGAVAASAGGTATSPVNAAASNGAATAAVGTPLALSSGSTPPTR
ncbi:hypothetical protein I4F81_011217 [Pyropia yezoensis]|uniref:Uncharacterized protein n=1 Tax=Pyropia yezoensis TaxID=2788 RepID=A0ACC3CFL9_PYRYE|nr:hypothetical protein I4F81_011217 [Neopyropia yezoensis]